MLYMKYLSLPISFSILAAKDVLKKVYIYQLRNINSTIGLYTKPSGLRIHVRLVISKLNVVSTSTFVMYTLSSYCVRVVVFDVL